MGIFSRKRKKNIDGLIRDLKDEDEGVRDAAVKALVNIGEPAVEPLIEALKDGNANFRYMAAEALEEIGDRRAVEPLIEALKDKDFTVRGMAASALGNIKDARAVEPLIKALKDEGRTVRSSAAEALEKIAWQPKDNVEKAYYLIALGQWDELVKLGKPAVEPLIEALKDKDSDVRSSAAEALGEIGNPCAVEPFIGALKDVEPRVRKAAFFALEKIAKQAKVDESLRQSAIDAVKQVDIDRLNMELGKFYTSSPDKAVEMLFDKAMAIVPTISQENFVKAYNRMLASGPSPLVEGSESEVKRLILGNAKALAREHGFQNFSIKLYLFKGYKGEEAAQMVAWFYVRESPIGKLVHLWKTDNAFHAYGHPELLSSKGAAKVTRKKTKKQPAVDLEGRSIKFESLDSFKKQIEVSPHGVYDSAPLLLDEDPDLEQLFVDPPIIQKPTEQNRQFWASAEASAQLCRITLVTGYLQHPKPEVRLKTLDMIKKYQLLNVNDQLLFDLLAADPDEIVRREVARITWLSERDVNCEYAVNKAKDEITYGSENDPVGPTRAREALALLVEAAPDEDARRALKHLISLPWP